MSKTKFKSLVTIILIIMLASSVCLATDEKPIESGVTETTDSSNPEVAPISEGSSESVTTTEDAASTTDTTEDSWVNSDLYVTGENITVNQVVDGNAFIIGSVVNISGEIGGDLFVIADKLTISSENQGGYVYSNIFAMANEITIDGIVYDVYAMCNSFKLDTNGYVYRDIKLISKDVNLLGFVRRDAYITASNLNFTYKPDAPTIINGNIHANFETINFAPTTEEVVGESSKVIAGNFTYSSNSESDIIPTYTTGESTFSKSAINTTENKASSIAYNYLIAFLGIAILTMVVMLVLNKVSSDFVNNTNNILLNKIGPVIGFGILGLLVSPIVILILVMTRLGVYLSFALASLYALLIAISTPILAITISKIICDKKKITKNSNRILISSLIAGVIFIIMELLKNVNILGTVVILVVNILGIGITLYGLFNKNMEVKPKNKKVKETTRKTRTKKQNNEKKNETKDETKNDDETK